MYKYYKHIAWNLSISTSTCTMVKFIYLSTITNVTTWPHACMREGLAALRVHKQIKGITYF